MKKLLLYVCCLLFVASCTTARYSAQGNSVVSVDKSDLSISAPKTTTVKVTKILGVDWANLFTKQGGDVSGTIVAGSMNPFSDKTVNKAVYQLMKENPGYDMVLYPVVESNIKNYVVMSEIEVKITARLAKMK